MLQADVDSTLPPSPSHHHNSCGNTAAQLSEDLAGTVCGPLSCTLCDLVLGLQYMLRAHLDFIAVVYSYCTFVYYNLIVFSQKKLIIVSCCIMTDCDIIHT